MTTQISTIINIIIDTKRLIITKAKQLYYHRIVQVCLHS